MRLTLAAVGRLKAGAERELARRYAERIGAAGKGLGIGPLKIVEIAESRLDSAARRREAEAKALADRLPERGLHLTLLDATGLGLDSAGFAGWLAERRRSGVAELVLAIGGPDGHGETLRARADAVLSLGPMTLPHGLARVVLAEQVYRALTILAGHPYHRS